MTQSGTLKKLRRAHWRSLERALKQAHADGVEAGLKRARGTGRRGRTIRGDSTVAGLIRQIERHFGLDRYGFELRIVHRGSGRRLGAADQIRKYRVEE
jgi:hypothetical protein